MSHQSSLAIAISALLATTALASPIGLPGPGPDYGFHWATIGDPGNRPYSAEELKAWGWVSGWSYSSGASVDDTYRMSKYETTTAQWFEFVQTAWPQVVGNAIEEDRLTGSTIMRAGGQWFVAPALEPASPHWTWVARYCNWLHNGKGTDPSSWASGVYDTSTFYVDENGIPQHDMTRAPGAKFFLPTAAEWKKAAHWDPNKNDGEGGYWKHVNGTDEPLIAGHPDNGGQTSAGSSLPFNDPNLKQIGVYPEVTSPWGLYDMSGGLREYVEDSLSLIPSEFSPFAAGSKWGFSHSMGWDELPHHLTLSAGTTGNGGIGFRLAAAIPGPGAVMAYSLMLTMALRRRRSW